MYSDQATKVEYYEWRLHILIHFLMSSSPDKRKEVYPAFFQNRLFTFIVSAECGLDPLNVKQPLCNCRESKLHVTFFCKLYQFHMQFLHSVNKIISLVNTKSYVKGFSYCVQYKLAPSCTSHKYS